MKAMMRFAGAFIGMLAIFCIIACNNSTKKLTSLLERTPPFQNVSVKPFSRLIDPQADNEIKTILGSKFNIPRNAFVYENGVVVKDSVEVKISEFRTAGEILMSGIPMTCDSAGKTYNFESAGMFEIRGNCNGEEVYLADGKAINVDFASFESGNYNFYFLNEATGKWETKGTSKIPEAQTKAVTDSSTKVQSNVPETKLTKVAEPRRIDKKRSVLNFDIQLEGFPELNVYSGIVWQYSGNAKFPDPDKNKWIYNIDWEKFHLTSQGDSLEYVLELTADGKRFTTSVVPVLNEKNYNKAMAVFKKNMETYNEQLAQISKETDRRSAEAAVVRAFSINEMGIYNWDRMFKQPQVVALNANFRFDQIKLNDFNTVTLFFITDDDRTVIKLPESEWNKFAFDPDKSNKILAVLPEDKIAYFGSKDFEKIDVEQVRTTGNYSFTLKVTDKKISSVDELNAFLGRI
jgi:hypothetical protein